MITVEEEGVSKLAQTLEALFVAYPIYYFCIHNFILDR